MEEKKEYEKPEITFEKKIETLAATCDSSWLGGAPCMKSPPGCSAVGS